MTLVASKNKVLDSRTNVKPFLQLFFSYGSKRDNSPKKARFTAMPAHVAARIIRFFSPSTTNTAMEAPIREYGGKVDTASLDSAGI
jgi:hypothetical protein